MNLDHVWRFDLVRGHTSFPEHGACLLAAVSWLANRQHSDRPKSVCPVLAIYGRAINDALEFEERQQLKVFIYRLANSRDPANAPVRAQIMSEMLARLQVSGQSSYLGAAARRMSSILCGGKSRARAWHDSRILIVALARCEISHRAAFVGTVLAAYDLALHSGRQGVSDPARNERAMNAFSEACEPPRARDTEDLLFMDVF